MAPIAAAKLRVVELVMGLYCAAPRTRFHLFVDQTFGLCLQCLDCADLRGLERL